MDIGLVQDVTQAQLPVPHSSLDEEVGSEHPFLVTGKDSRAVLHLSKLPLTLPLGRDGHCVLWNSSDEHTKSESSHVVW